MLIKKIQELTKQKEIAINKEQVKKAKRIDKAIKACFAALRAINDIGTTPNYERDY